MSCQKFLDAFPPLSPPHVSWFGAWKLESAPSNRGRPSHGGCDASELFQQWREIIFSPFLEVRLNCSKIWRLYLAPVKKANGSVHVTTSGLMTTCNCSVCNIGRRGTLLHFLCNILRIVLLLALSVIVLSNAFFWGGGFSPGCTFSRCRPRRKNVRPLWMLRWVLWDK